jgi:predicted ATP-grasp superfamily ATP-dependent carboligase
VNSIDSAEVAETGENLTAFLQSLEYRGIFSAEFVRDERDGLLKLIEVNTRAWAYIQFAWECGVNIADMYYRDALNLDIEPVSAVRTGIGLVVMPNDFAAVRAERKSGTTTYRRAISEWLAARSALYSRGDSAPLITRWFEVIAGRFRR